MACGATLKRSHEFDPLHSPGRSSKRLCMPGELMSPLLQNRRLASSNTALSGAAQKFVNDQIAAGWSPGLGQCGGQLRQMCNPQLDRLKLSPAHMAQPAVRTASLSETELSRHAASTAGSSPSSKGDIPLFTMKQVDVVCKRMVQEHEERCREQFDKVLSNKLAEQYESFLNFNHDQLSNRFHSCDASYVS